MGRTSQARDKLIQAAIELIHRRSYADVGVQELCAAAGVQKGTFYHFFPAKRDLALAALDAQWARLREDVLEAALRQPLAPLDQLRWMFGRAMRMQGSGPSGDGEALVCPGCTFGNLAAELSTQDEIVRRKLNEIFDQWAGYFERVLCAAQTRGEWAGPDPSVTAHALLAYLQGVLMLSKARQDPARMARLADEAARLLDADRAAAGQPWCSLPDADFHQS
jgi:TetR/AcrR family transcriptional repressor of nem operon